MGPTLLTRAFVRDTWSPAVQALFAGAAISGVGASLALLQSGGVLGLSGWLAWMGLSAVAALPLTLPLAFAYGPVAALSRWRENGAWHGVQSMGIGGRRLIPAGALMGAFGAGLMALSALCLSPLALREASQISQSQQAWPVGVPRQMGGLAVWAQGVDGDWGRDVVGVSAGRVLGATQARFGRGGGQMWLEMLGGTVLVDGPTPVRVQFAQGRVRVDGRSRRTALAARSTPDLIRAAERTQRVGADAAYEWAVLYKRFTHVLLVGMLPVSLLPLGAGRRPLLQLGCVGIGLAIFVRVGDLLAPALGPLVSASFGPMFAAFLGAFLWSTWTDR